LKKLIAAVAALVLAAMPTCVFAQQGSYVMPASGPMSMAAFVETYLNPGLSALASCSSGSSAPANGASNAPQQFQCWINTSVTPPAIEIYDGAQWVTEATLNTTTHTYSVSASALSGLLSGCTTTGQLGMDPTATTDNDTQLAVWKAQLALSTTHTGCLIAGPGVFRFANAQSFTMPNGLWSTTSSTPLTVATGSQTLTVGSCSGLGINAGSTVSIVHQTLTASQIMDGTVTSCTGTTLVANITAISGSGTFTAWIVIQSYIGTQYTAGVSVMGQGPDTTEFRFDSTATGGLLFNFAGVVQQLTVQGFSITTASVGGQTNPCLAFENTYPFVGAEQNTNEIRNVTCRGADGYGQTDYWATGFYAQYVSNINFDADQFFGPDGATGQGTAFDFNNPGADGCVSAQGPWQCGENYNINSSYANSAANCFFYGPNTQFVKIHHFQCLNSGTGILVPAGAGTLQGLTVDASTWYTYQYGIEDLNGIKNTVLGPGDMWSLNTTDPALYLTNNWALTIIGEQFTPFQGGNGLQPAINIPGTSHDISMITGNVISGGGSTFASSCIFLGSTSTGVQVQSNAYSGCTTKVDNAGTGNTVGGGSD
jgi:hypothetical protein